MRIVRNIIAKQKIKNVAEDDPKKNRFHKIGVVFKREDGSMCAKIDMIPTFAEFDGWLELMTPLPPKE